MSYGRYQTAKQFNKNNRLYINDYIKFITVIDDLLYLIENNYLQLVSLPLNDVMIKIDYISEYQKEIKLYGTKIIIDFIDEPNDNDNELTLLNPVNEEYFSQYFPLDPFLLADHILKHEYMLYDTEILGI